METESPKKKQPIMANIKSFFKRITSVFSRRKKKESDTQAPVPVVPSTAAHEAPAEQRPSKKPFSMRDWLHARRESVPVEMTVWLRSGRELKHRRPSTAEVWHNISHPKDGYAAIVRFLKRVERGLVSLWKKTVRAARWVGAKISALFGSLWNAEKFSEIFHGIRRKKTEPGKQTTPPERKPSFGDHLRAKLPSEAEIVLRSGRVIQINRRTIERTRKSINAALAKAFPSLYGVKTQEVIDFSRNLATLLESGLPILQALQVLHRQSKKGRFKQVLEKMMEDLEQGDTLSEACSKHPSVFGNFYVRLIRVGEETGNMETVLRSLVKQMKKDQVLKSKLKKSMAYPCFIMVASLVVMILMMVVVMPTFMDIYTNANMEPPILLKLMTDLGDFMKSYAVIILAVLVVVGVTLMWYTSNTTSGIKAKDTFMMKCPVLGRVVLLGRISRLCNNMAVLLAAGIPLTEGFHLMIQGSDSVLLKHSLTEVNVKIHAGESLSAAMQTQPLFPLLMTQMVEVGEMTGKLETNLEIVGVYYEEETDASVGKLVSVLGPGMMLLIGGIVGTMVVTLFSSMTGMYSGLG